MQKSKIKNQNYNSKIKTFYFLPVLLPFAFLLLTLEKADASALSLGVSPPLIKIEGRGNDHIETPLAIHNFDDESVELTIRLSPFTQANGETGAPVFVKEDKRYASLFQNVHLLEEENVVKRLSLSPNQEKSITLAIDVPEDINVSDYSFSIIFMRHTPESDEPPQTSQTTITAGIAANVLITQAGTTASGVIEEFAAPRFLEQGPVTFTVRVKNTGNHLTTPEGTITIRNVLGHRVGLIELLPVNVLPGTIRRVPEPVWPETFLLGPYTATLNLSLSNQGPTFTQTIHFFAFPTLLFGGVVLSVFTLLLLVTRIKRHIR